MTPSSVPARVTRAVHRLASDLWMSMLSAISGLLSNRRWNRTRTVPGQVPANRRARTSRFSPLRRSWRRVSTRCAHEVEAESAHSRRLEGRRRVGRGHVRRVEGRAPVANRHDDPRPGFEARLDEDHAARPAAIGVLDHVVEHLLQREGEVVDDRFLSAGGLAEAGRRLPERRPPRPHPPAARPGIRRVPRRPRARTGGRARRRQRGRCRPARARSVEHPEGRGSSRPARSEPPPRPRTPRRHARSWPSGGGSTPGTRGAPREARARARGRAPLPTAARFRRRRESRSGPLPGAGTRRNPVPARGASADIDRW